jgi:hypothetical protein
MQAIGRSRSRSSATLWNKLLDVCARQHADHMATIVRNLVGTKGARPGNATLTLTTRSNASSPSHPAGKHTIEVAAPDYCTDQDFRCET